MMLIDSNYCRRKFGLMVIVPLCMVAAGFPDGARFQLPCPLLRQHENVHDYHGNNLRAKPVTMDANLLDCSSMVWVQLTWNH